MRGAGKDESEGAGAWTCARATAWNSQHWLREGAWWIEGVSHRPSAQRRARKLAERTVIAIVYEWNDSLQSHACSCVATRRNAMRRAPRRSDRTSGNIEGFPLPRRIAAAKSAGGFCDFLKNGGYQAWIPLTAAAPLIPLRGQSRGIADCECSYGSSATDNSFPPDEPIAYLRRVVSELFREEHGVRSCLSFWLLFPLYHACPIVYVYLFILIVVARNDVLDKG